MKEITDPLIDAGGRVYSLRGVKRLWRAVTKSGRTVKGATERRSERRVRNGKI